jgi:hypothetical protein
MNNLLVAGLVYGCRIQNVSEYLAEESVRGYGREVVSLREIRTLWTNNR